MAIDQILLFTQNKGKVAEFNQMLSTTNGASDIEIVDSTVVPVALRNPEETGQTFVENAIIKAVAGYTATGLVTLADDSGLCVDALDGAPGVRSSRFAVDGGWQEPSGTEDSNALKTIANNERLVVELQEVPEEMRTARFSCALALVLPEEAIGDEDKLLMTNLELIETHADLPNDWLILVAKGHVEGRIVEESMGSAGFGYDPLFWSFDLQTTFGNATSQDKAAVSHRGRALSNLWHGLLAGEIL